MEDRRGSQRLSMYAGVFILHGETPFLTEVENVSTGGASVTRPKAWSAERGQLCRLYFVLDQDSILLLRGRVTHLEGKQLGFVFEPNQAIEAERLVGESRRWQ